MVNPKCIEKAPAAEVKAQLERENVKVRLTRQMVLV